MSRRDILVIGLGNPDCGDDGIGPLAVKALSRRLPGGVRVLIRSGDVLALLEDWRGADAVLVVDAAALISEPGRIHRIDAVRQALPKIPPVSSTHGFGLSEAVDLGRALGALPPQLILFAVEGISFAPGAVMTPEVAAAAEAVMALLLDEVRHIQDHPCKATAPIDFATGAAATR
jgi:hydrogenase maturation protease